MNENEIGTNLDLREFKARINAMGITLYLDFVPNHSAVDSVQAKNNPEYFV